jgi:hypothetical protein
VDWQVQLDRAPERRQAVSRPLHRGALQSPLRIDEEQLGAVAPPHGLVAAVGRDDNPS